MAIFKCRENGPTPVSIQIEEEQLVGAEQTDGRWGGIGLKTEAEA